MLTTPLKTAAATILTMLLIALTIACGSDEPDHLAAPPPGQATDAEATITALDAKIVALQTANDDREATLAATQRQTLQAPKPTPFVFPTPAPTHTPRAHAHPGTARHLRPQSPSPRTAPGSTRQHPLPTDNRPRALPHNHAPGDFPAPRPARVTSAASQT